MDSQFRFQEFINLLKEVLEYQKDSCYKNWKYQQFQTQLEKLILTIYTPFTSLLLLINSLFQMVKANDKYQMFVEILVKLLLMLGIFLLVIRKIILLSNQKLRNVLLLIIFFFYEIFICLIVCQMIIQDQLKLEDESYLLLFGITSIIFSILLPMVPLQFMNILVLLSLLLIRNSQLIQSIQNIVVYIYIFLLVVFVQEISQIQSYKTLKSLLTLIETNPNAICIVDPNNREVLFSNEKYEILTRKFNECMVFDEEKERNNFAFLEQLQMKLIDEEAQNNNFFNIFDENSLIQLKKVKFHQKDKLILNPSGLCRQESKMRISQHFKNLQECFSLGKNPEKKVYISDMEVKYEADHDPQKIYTFKKQQSRFNPQNSISCDWSNKRKRNYVQNSFKSMDFQEQKGSHRSESVQKLRQSTITHQIRLLISQINNSEFFGQNENIQILTISELTPLLMKNKIKKLEEVKRNIMRSISHELVTYLMGAKVYLDQVVSSPDCFHDQEQFNLILKSHKLLQLQILKIKDLIDFNEILNGQFRIQCSQMNLTKEIKECMYLFEDQIKAKKLEIHQPNSDYDIMVIGQPTKFKQVMSNLLSNSIKFTKLGKIEITVLLKDAEGSHKLFYEVKVKDTGLGMTKDQKGNLIRKLHFNIEDEKKVSESSVGIGMGLTVCKEIVQQMSPQQMNYIFVESEFNVGSSFYFYLQPIESMFSKDNLSSLSLYLNQSHMKQKKEIVHKESWHEIDSEQQIPDLYQIPLRSIVSNQQTTRKMIQEQPVSSCRCRKILIVDDEQFIFESVKLLIFKIGKFEVQQAYDGQQCLNIIESEQRRKCSEECKVFSLIMMDINMPIMDGNRAVRLIRQMERNSCWLQKLKVIAVTGFTSEKERSQCLENGFDLVMHKPISLQEIKEVFEQFEIDA